MKRWELLACTSCEHEHMREAKGQLTLPCVRCGSPMIALSVRVQRRRAQPAVNHAERVARVLEQMKGAA